MSDQLLGDSAEWLLRLNNHSTNERYALGTAARWASVAKRFLIFLEKRRMAVEAAQPEDVEQFLREELRRYRRRHGSPSAYRDWRSARTDAVHALLRLAQGQWPPVLSAVTPAERLCHVTCEEYLRWMTDLRGLAQPTASVRCEEARRFIEWLGPQAAPQVMEALDVTDVDRYMRDRSGSLRRSSMKTVATWVRDFLRWLHTTKQTRRDLSTAVIAPSAYALESVPLALKFADIEKVLAVTRQDRTAKGIRDYAILLLLAKYGARAGEIVRLRLDDIDWRKDFVRIRHSKTGTTSCLPLLPEVGEAVLDYLQKARPQTTFREIFIRNRAPYRPFKSGTSLGRLVGNRLDNAGMVISGKRGTHVFRHARAVSLLRAATPLKVIGDLLGHRASSSTMVYLKLATEDLRAISLEVPAEVTE